MKYFKENLVDGLESEADENRNSRASCCVRTQSHK